MSERLPEMPQSLAEWVREEADEIRAGQPSVDRPNMLAILLARFPAEWLSDKEDLLQADTIRRLTWQLNQIDYRILPYKGTEPPYLIGVQLELPFLEVSRSWLLDYRRANADLRALKRRIASWLTVHKEVNRSADQVMAWLAKQA